MLEYITIWIILSSLIWFLMRILLTLTKDDWKFLGKFYGIISLILIVVIISFNIIL